MKKQGFAPLIKLIEEIGGWPVVQGELWNDKSQSWEEIIYEANLLGLTTDFPLHVSPARLNSTNSTHFRTFLYVISKVIWCKN